MFFVGIFQAMENIETLEKQAEVTARALAGNTHLKPKRHVVIYHLLTGRARYPFKMMVVGDFFLLDGHDHAVAARNALKTFNRRLPHRRFTIKQDAGSGFWICRRTV